MKHSAEPVNWLEREFPDPADRRSYAQERALVAISESLGELMEQRGMNRTALAEILGVTKGRVSRMLDGSNITVRTIGDVLWACGLELKDIAVGPLGVSAPVQMGPADLRDAPPSVRQNTVAYSTQVEVAGLGYQEMPTLQLCA